jgi:hypothetical protein
MSPREEKVLNELKQIKGPDVLTPPDPEPRPIGGQGAETFSLTPIDSNLHKKFHFVKVLFRVTVFYLQSIFKEHSERGIREIAECFSIKRIYGLITKRNDSVAGM